MKRLGRILFRLFWGFRAFNEAGLGAPGPVLLIPNHVSWFDWLLIAVCLDGDWKFVVSRATSEISWLHRWIMISSCYGQQSRDRADYRDRDPENRWLWKMNRRRLDFEALRDSLLSVAGRLDTTAGGPSVDLASPEASRRSVYGQIDRQNLPGMLSTFDFSSPDTHSPERYSTTVPRQALFLMNSPLVLAAARNFASRPELMAANGFTERATRMIRLAWGRAPTNRELEAVAAFVAADKLSAGGDEQNTWEAVAQALLLANEFVYVD